MKINTEGYIGNIRLISSPNCDERPAGSLINLLVIHYISLPPDKFGGNEVIDLFTNQLDPKVDSSFQILSAVRVSAHFFIRRDGETIQFVSCKSAPGMQEFHIGRVRHVVTIFLLAWN